MRIAAWISVALVVARKPPKRAPAREKSLRILYAAYAPKNAFPVAICFASAAAGMHHEGSFISAIRRKELLATICASYVRVRFAHNSVRTLPQHVSSNW